MKTCWDILRINPTSDVELIRKAYIDLMKQYHPDTVQSPEMKRKYHIISVKLNRAYEEAKRAATMHPQSPEQVIIIRSEPWYHNVYSSMIAFIIFMFVFVGVSLFISIVPKSINTLPSNNIIRVLFNTILVSAVSLIFVGVLIMGILDGIVAALFPSNIVRKIGLEKYEYKLLWFVILFVNVSVFYFGDIGTFPGGHPMNDIYETIFKVVGALTIPLWWLVDWLRELFIFNKTKNKSELLKESDSE